MDSEIIMQMKALRIKLGELWDQKGRTDQEILDLAERFDQLLNQYYRMKKQHTEEF